MNSPSSTHEQPQPGALGPADWLVLRDRVVVVTGSASGIGAACARAFAQAGARVALMDIDEAGVQGLAHHLTQEGAQALALRCDTGQPDSVHRAFEAITRGLGEVDVLVNNAGVLRPGPWRR